jgi:hypothetical protein
MSNNEEIIEAAQRVFEKLSKMDSEEFKKLLEEHTKGDVYESMKELLDIDLYFTGEKIGEL